MKNQFFPNKMVWQLGLTTGLSHEFKLRANSLASLGLLSCSATAGMTLQFPWMLHASANFGGLPVMSHPRVFASLHNLEHFFTLSHSLPLQDSHINTGLLIAKIQANLARNKSNKIVDKIQPYSLVHGTNRDKKLRIWFILVGLSLICLDINFLSCRKSNLF